jgi:hypothetical protein
VPSGGGVAGRQERRYHPAREQPDWMLSGCLISFSWDHNMSIGDSVDGNEPSRRLRITMTEAFWLSASKYKVCAHYSVGVVRGCGGCGGVDRLLPPHGAGCRRDDRTRR